MTTGPDRVPAPALTFRAAAALFIGYTLLTLLITYPVAWHLSTRVPHDLGDPLLSTVILWWNAHSMPLGAQWWNGSFFWPATGTLTFSDHRLGASLLASPLQWTGLRPLTAYNITLLATFPLCALAAHWLAYTLTGRYDAALLAGLAYGFNPYRFAHIEHLELLAAFGMPAALAALHQYLTHRSAKWIVVFAGALLLQALSCSYYFLFFLILLGLWMLWFLRWGSLTPYRIIAAVAIVIAVMSPIAARYLAEHKHYGLTRGLGDIVTLSGDVTSIVTGPPLSLLWGWTSSLNGPERQLFPGAVIVILTAVGVVAAVRSQPPSARSNRVPAALLAVGAVFALIAASVWQFGPWRAAGISVGTPFKPFSLAFFSWLGALGCSSWVRDAYARRSAFAFFLLTSVFLFVCSLGPKPAFLGRQILYQPPYAWLMRLSVFGESVRVPARFAMLVALTLSMAAALAYARLTRRRPSTVLIATAIAAAILADSWNRPLPALAPPAAWPSEVSTVGVHAFVELPLGETTHDAAAMYRSTLSGLPTANGYSGYFPAHYEALRLALDERDETALDVLAAPGPLLVMVERAWPYSNERLAWLRGNPRARQVAENADAVWFQVVARPRAATSCGSSTLPIAALADTWGPADLPPVTDGNDDTFWSTGESQQVGDMLTLDLGRVAQPCSVRLSLGSHVGSFPRMLNVSTSADGSSWQTSFMGKLGGEVVASALVHPRAVAVELPLAGQPARFIRLRVEAEQPEIAWIVTELAVTSR
ncbi:MAG TPA: discoidin domain-containing protein [Vicinamibacterales bacterium]|nr:discoidin domain-containing protein [Vicinamibacterales bacterium]